jgi:hypothetical protein
MVLQRFKPLRSFFEPPSVVWLKKGTYHDYVNGAPGKSREEMVDAANYKRARP